MEILQIKDLTFRYPERDRDALDHVDLTVVSGDFMLICGESGCGKSTLLKLMKREIAPFGEKKGDILYRGIPLSKLDERTAAAEIGFVSQDPESQIVTDTVWHELAFGLESLGYDTQVIRRRVAEMASYFGIGEWFRKKTAELSGGQKQLLNLASVMVMQPKLLLLDEPTAQLDPIAAENFVATLRKLNRELGLTIIMAEHRMEEVFPISDRVVLMESGKVAFAEEPKKMGVFMRENPDHPMRHALPCAMRIFAMLHGEGDSPITVREGRKYITEKYENRVASFPPKPSDVSGDTVFELKDVWFRYGRDLPDVMKGVSLSVRRGEHFCILGANGVGKSTALGVMAGLNKPYRGKVLVDKKSIGDRKSPCQKSISLLPQNPREVFLENTLLEDLRNVCQRMKYSAEEGDKLISDITGELGISHLLSAHPNDLSGGEIQKAALGKILLQRPEILLLDEPTKGIDACAKRTLAEIIGKLKQKGVTVITVSHDVEFAAEWTDRCALLFDGELISTDTPSRFFSENSFYTSAANRISRGHFENAILCEEVVELCRINERKGSS